MHFSFSQAAAAATLLGLSPGVFAQAAGLVRLDAGPTLQAVTAATPAPAVAYTSAFADVPRGVEIKAVDWKAANAAVAQFPRGHADVLKWEQNQPRATTPEKVTK